MIYITVLITRVIKSDIYYEINIIEALIGMTSEASLAKSHCIRKYKK